MSAKSEIRQIIIDTLSKSSLSEYFCAVYMFGSLLKEDSKLNDIDLLFVYTRYDYAVATKLKETKKRLESILKIDVDVTALSLNELNETDFLERIHNFRKINIENPFVITN